MPKARGRSELVKKVKENPNEVLRILDAVMDSYEDSGCDGCGTISQEVCNDVRKFLGYEPLGDDDEEDDEEQSR